MEQRLNILEKQVDLLREQITTILVSMKPQHHSHATGSLPGTSMNRKNHKPNKNNKNKNLVNLDINIYPTIESFTLCRNEIYNAMADKVLSVSEISVFYEGGRKGDIDEETEAEYELRNVAFIKVQNKIRHQYNKLCKEVYGKMPSELKHHRKRLTMQSYSGKKNVTWCSSVLKW